MIRSCIRHALLAATGLAVSISAPVTGGESIPAADAPRPLEGESVSIRLVRWSTPVDGARRQTGSAATGLTIGGHGSLYATAGFLSEDGSVSDELCPNAIGSGGRPDDAHHVWTVDARVVDATLERIDVELAWERTDIEDGRREVRRFGPRVVTFGEGDTHVLDYAELSEDGVGSTCARNVMLEVEVGITEDPLLVASRIEYDLWLVDEGPDGRRRSRHVRRAGGQGELLPLEFEPLRWQVPGAAFADGSPAEVVGAFRTEVRGRARRDGTIDLLLDATRWLGVAPAGQARTGGVGDGGKRRVNVTPGEPVRLVLPSPQGMHRQWTRGESSGSSVTSSDDRADETGVRVGDGAIRVEFGPFFRDHETSLILTATRAP